MYLDNGDPGCSIFTTAFTVNHADRSRRPVAFVWNGGPGAATWPLREQLSPRTFGPSDAAAGFSYIDNPSTLLDEADLVFIDPPGTGYSEMFSEAAKTAFWGVKQDADVIANFICFWLARHGRHNSPVFLIGESYGGTRAIEVAARLARRPTGTVRMTGVLLVSPGLTGPKVEVDDPANAHLLLPTQALTAQWYKKGAFRGLDQTALAQRAERFAAGPLTTLPTAVGDQLSHLASDLSTYVGLSVSEIVAVRCRINATYFRTQLLKSSSKELDIYDARETYDAPLPGHSHSIIQSRPGYDLNAAIVGSLSDDLGYFTRSSYNRDPMEVYSRWAHDQSVDTGVITSLSTIVREYGVKVAVFSGYFDFAVPYMIQKEQISTLDLPEADIMFRVYPCGHAIFGDEDHRPLTTEDARRFIAGAF